MANSFRNTIAFRQIENESSTSEVVEIYVPI